MKHTVTTLLIGIFLLFTSCSEQKKTKTDTPYIVTTTGMIADLVENIAGQAFKVEGLMGPGVDPHLYKASQSDISKLSRADVIFYNGLQLEGKMTDILKKMKRKKTVVAISDGIARDSLIKLEGAKYAFDPHIWFDVHLWKQTIPTVVKHLRAEFPEYTNQFTQNAEQMTQKLDTLHHWVKQQVQTVPEQQRIMITAHDAFEYFGVAYGIKVYGLQGISTVAEYGVHDVNRMVDLILENKIRAVFVETSVPKRSIEAVVAGVRARDGDVHIGGTLYSDAMGAAGSGANTYIGMVRSNVTTIVNALK
ncbi:MAG: manganese transporter [Caldithrix sp.]|nr:manganese transporter [Caldithrix sp.]